MSYSCGYGHTSYNPNCDACDSAVESTSEYESDSNIKHRAALRGLTKQEYLALEDSDDE